MPKDWKYSLSINNHSEILLTIQSAPYDLLTICGHYQLSQYYLERYEIPAEALQILEKAKDCLNTDNFNKSDSQTDYFHVGHYIAINLGKWNKPFINNAA